MLPLTAREIAEVCEGSLERLDPGSTITGVTIDSRAVRAGDLFVALAGERVDGHEFAGDAIRHGAVAALAARSLGDVPAVRVDDPAKALMRIAGAVRGRSDARVIAITGSSGKTATKQLAAAACATAFRTVASAASFNNELGVPLTICGLESDTQVLVAEVGSRGVGHIAALMPLLRPDVSVVTNVGPAHHEMFGSLENTAVAKSEIVTDLATDGIAILNADDARVVAMAGRTHARVVTFGTSSVADVRAEGITLDERARASFKVTAPDGTATVSLRLSGEHMVSNALAAIAAACAVGVALDDAANGVGTVDGLPMRMQVVESPSGVVIINDAYNSNPASAAAALKALVAIGRGRRTWAVLGEMAELGPIALEEQDRLGRLAVRLGVSRLVAVGASAQPACEAARFEGMTPDESVFVSDVAEATAHLLREVATGDVVLIKASRVAGLERIATALEKADA